MKNKFKKFLAAISTDDNKSLMESVKKGYSVIMESGNAVSYIDATRANEYEIDSIDDIEYVYNTNPRFKAIFDKFGITVDAVGTAIEFKPISGTYEYTRATPDEFFIDMNDVTIDFDVRTKNGGNTYSINYPADSEFTSHIKDLIENDHDAHEQCLNSSYDEWSERKI